MQLQGPCSLRSAAARSGAPGKSQQLKQCQSLFMLGGCHVCMRRCVHSDTVIVLSSHVAAECTAHTAKHRMVL